MFIEVVRLFVVLLGTVAGFAIGRDLSTDDENAALTISALGGMLGCLAGYVCGGIFGRLIERGMGVVERSTERLPGPELLAGGAGAMIGSVLGLLLSMPLIIALPQHIGLPITGMILWITGWAGLRIAVRKTEELFALAGLSTRPLIRSTPFAAGDGYVVDTSAIMDGQLLPLVRAGLVEGDLLVPRFVLDELQGLADAADEGRSRRAQRGLEILDLVRGSGVARVCILDDEIPEFAEVDTKLVALAKRLQVRLLTTDSNLARVAEVQGIATCNLRQVASEMWPARLPGDVVNVELVREGREPGQGVGFLDDGSMVVVSAASELVGAGAVEVTVTSTIPTSMGRMVFARLAS